MTPEQRKTIAGAITAMRSIDAATWAASPVAHTLDKHAENLCSDMEYLLQVADANNKTK